MTPAKRMRRTTHLLSDQPAATDAFDAGHDRVARALAGLLDDEDGGKAIALAGPFGSGKSTVVRLLEQELADSTEESCVFVYDAWEHQGDPLRRSFIEGLIAFLRSEGWAGDKEWDDEQERLARRKEKTTVETKPKLTTTGRWVAVSLFFSPLGIVAVNSFVKTKDGVLQLGWPEVAFWTLGLLVFLLPLLITGVAWLRGNTDPFYLLVKKSEQEEETKTIQTPDPTTIEFQTIFQKIVGRTLSNPNRRLIIVVDNLDRLPPEQALQAWATMRTFFASGSDREQWEERFWLLVPINFDALNGVFGPGEGMEVEEADPTADANPEAAAKSQEAAPVDPAQEAVQAFADKTFHTVFHVAPPVLSDWEAFMKDQLRTAFPKPTSDGDAVDIDYHAVYRVYRTEAVRGNQIPTPRDIKIFINRLSALYRQWGGKMDLKTLAAFELMRSRISPNGHEITEGTLLPERLAAELDPEEWQKQFASLHFNVDPERSIQVLIGEEVQTAMETGDDGPVPLAELQQVDGFDAVLEDVVRKIQAEGVAREVANSGFALADVKISTPAVRRTVWKLLRERILEESD